MNCIIIDDDELANAILEQLIKNNPNLTLESSFSSAIQAIKYLNKNTVNLVFSDIKMPELTGLDFIRTLKSPPKIILTSSDENFAIDASKHNCVVDFLVKPIKQERFNTAVQKAINNIKFCIRRETR
ncbi:LytR/AlgR family response regulator transcription factor [Formosa sp. 3Alg 14/1]|uniref:LytR/AlgR family response regulator transcription factor n=1 Tax=unclassified Formosa TaxID=2644710 RepID=UPI0039BEBFCF